MCVMGFTDTCPDPVPHIKTGSLQLNSSPTSQPDGWQRGPAWWLFPTAVYPDDVRTVARKAVPLDPAR